MLTFSHALRSCPLVSEGDKESFSQIQVACSALTAMTAASSRNLEDLLSLLSVLKRGFRLSSG